MKIQFENVVPAPLAGVFDSDSQVWGTSLEIDTSKRYMVHAPSGKGKSTFVHCIYGLRDDYGGNVTVEGDRVADMTADQIATLRKDNFSVIFQDLRLFLNLSARENLEIKKALYPDAGWDKIEEMTHVLGVNHLLDRPARLLSYGERQRVAIIRSLIQPFDFLMMDEPFSHLDEGNIKKACELIEARCTENNAGFAVVSLGYEYFFTYDQSLKL